MPILLRILLGLILGLICAVGTTLYNLTKSNEVGTSKFIPNHSISDQSLVIFRVKKDTVKKH